MRDAVRAGLIMIMLGFVAACSDTAPTGSQAPETPAGPGSTPGDNSVASGGTLSFLTSAQGAPALQNGSVTMWAVQGEDRTGEVWYAGASGDRLLRLRVRKRAQIVAPNGQALAAGDSIRITITVSDVSRMIVNFQPAGLRFVGSEAADLTMWYRHAHPDFNRDGVVNGGDASVESTLAIFRQEVAGAPWQRMGSILNASNDEIEVSIGGFTNYVIAY
jgi:hypothetical protein